VRPRYLLYYTAEHKAAALRERIILIDTTTFPDFTDWDEAGQPLTDAIPVRYGTAIKRRYANVTTENHKHRPLDREATPATFSRLQTELHDVIWGGGGTNNNEVFVLITRLILCKIYDEKETAPGRAYTFQRLGDAISPESSTALVARMNELYRQSEDSYLALREPSPGPAFDTSRISPEKIAYVVGRLEGISVTENKHPGDLLGAFFEHIVAQDFTQTKGQFFTPFKLVHFMLELVDAASHAKQIMMHGRDHLGRPRLPYVIDPACGSGTFLVEYMKLIHSTLSDTSLVQQLPNRVREAHATWFSGPTGNAWARDYLFGIENNYDLGLAAKVNMVLHGDGSMNTWIASALARFADYWVEGRNNILGTEIPQGQGDPYEAQRNEQFDLVMSNPPFSLKLSPDEKSKVQDTFEVVASSLSEAIFIERWYQLLREGGRFCCVLPEALLDTARSAAMRLFLLGAFKIDAIVSLPYDAFRPFTSTKTCIVMGTKRSKEEFAKFRQALTRSRLEGASKEALLEALEEVGWTDEQIFMAEPTVVGYKRRKNLSDLPMPNQLYAEKPSAEAPDGADGIAGDVLSTYRAGPDAAPNPVIGFWTDLGSVAKRAGYRLDPKYRWLWDYKYGVALGRTEMAEPLEALLSLADLPKIRKGELTEETRVIDLEYVESRQALVSSEVPLIDELGSDKISFAGCDMAIAKLEPYLGKIIIRPPKTALGSTEWVGLRLESDLPELVVAYMLMLPEMCEAYRRLQSGKRHARFDPKEFLDLRVEVPSRKTAEELADGIQALRDQIIKLREQERIVRADIDGLFPFH
jgi:type I restriction enzyme M protein